MPQYDADDYMAKKDKNEDDIRNMKFDKTTTKMCPKCKLTLPLNNKYFGNNISSKDGFSNLCKRCKNASARKYNAKIRQEKSTNKQMKGDEFDKVRKLKSDFPELYNPDNILSILKIKKEGK